MRLLTASLACIVRAGAAQFRPTGAACVKPSLGDLFCGAGKVHDLPGKGQQALGLRHFQVAAGRRRQCVEAGQFVIALDGLATPLADIPAQRALAAHLNDLAKRRGGFMASVLENSPLPAIFSTSRDLWVGSEPGLENPRLGRANIVGIHRQFGVITEDPCEGLGRVRCCRVAVSGLDKPR